MDLTGHRKSGKTTLARATFPAKRYVSLENPDERAFALDDPKGFLNRFPDGAVIDEAQHCPALFSYIQTRVDAEGRPGVFVLTGSQNFNLISTVTQSLAGRAGLVQLLPFSLGEVAAAGLRPPAIEPILLRGLYPPLYDRPVPSADWYANYVMSYLERDVRSIANAHDLNLFQRFLRLCAARTGHLLNVSSLATDCGVAHGTARAWLGILEASYICFMLHPFHRNFGKRLVKMPKLYFVDTGLAAALLGIHDEIQMATHPSRPALFETMVIGEFLKQRFNTGLASNLYFWRDNVGTEIDLVIEEGATATAIEIKSGQTVVPDFFSGLAKWTKYAGADGSTTSLVYGGEESYERSGVSVVSWRDLSQPT